MLKNLKRLALAIFAIALICLSLTFTPKTEAVPQTGVTIYYSNAAHTTEVGRLIRGCNGTITQTGSTSKFFVFIPFECPL